MRSPAFAPALLLATALACTGCATLAGFVVGATVDNATRQAKVPSAAFGTLAPGMHVTIALADGSRVEGRLLDVVREDGAVRSLRVQPDGPSATTITPVADSAATRPREIPVGEIRKLVRRKTGLGPLPLFMAAGLALDVWLLLSVVGFD